MTTMTPALDAGAFAEQIIGAPLWSHQLDLVRSSARYRVLLAGRQAGKSRALAVLALHEAATKRDALVLLVSAGEVAARRLLEDVAALTSSSPLLSGSVLDESKSALTLSNGARIMSVPASSRQIRGWAVDLLIVDEAAFLDDEIWRAAEPSIVARAGSRVVLASTPWGSADHFFRALHQRGREAPDGMVQAFHWPSTVSPLVDEGLVEHWRATWPEFTFRTEVLAEWSDQAGAYFTETELAAAVTDLEPVDLAGARRLGSVCGGIDWGMRRDAHALAVLAVTGRSERGEAVLTVVHAEDHHRMPYSDWVARLEALTFGAGEHPSEGFAWACLASETSGVGQMPTEALVARLGGVLRQGVVHPVVTTARLKEDSFGTLKVLLNGGRLRLPRSPALLRQLRALEFEQLSGGGLRIAVPERHGHDDLAMALALSVVAMDQARAAARGKTRGIVPLG